MRAKKTVASRQKKTNGNQKSNPQTITIHGIVNSQRVPSRVFEEQIQQAVKNGARELHIIADGQHGLGGRIWPRGGGVKITVEGPAGQRLGSMGMPGTEILLKGRP